MASLDIEQARFNMIEQQIRPWEVLDPRVLEVLRLVPRERYVPADYAQLAFSDTEIPLGHGQSMMAPKIEARLLQALDVQPGDSVLEIGTGSGYLTACLAQLARHVTSLEIHEDLHAAASARLQSERVHNVALRVSDVTIDWPAPGEFDVIAVTGSVPLLPEELQQGLTVGGRLFVITGEAPTMSALLIHRVGEQEFSTESLFETSLPPLVNASKPQRFVF